MHDGAHMRAAHERACGSAHVRVVNIRTKKSRTSAIGPVGYLCDGVEGNGFNPQQTKMGELKALPFRTTHATLGYFVTTRFIEALSPPAST